jgi:hypothetical protein
LGWIWLTCDSADSQAVTTIRVVLTLVADELVLRINTILKVSAMASIARCDAVHQDGSCHKI